MLGDEYKNKNHVNIEEIESQVSISENTTLSDEVFDE